MLTTASLVAIAVLGAAVPAAAIPTTSTSPLSVVAAMLAEEVAVEGTVKSVDAKGGTIVLSNGKKSITVRTDKSTTYERDGKSVPMTELVVVGARVRVVHKDALASRVEPVAETPPSKPPGRSPTPEKPKSPVQPRPPAKP